MTIATVATLSATPLATPVVAGAPAFGHWNFDFVDAAGTKAPTQTGDGVTGVSADFDITTAAPGVATGTITAIDATGAVMGTPMTVVTPVLPYTLPATTFPAPSAAAFSFR